MRVQNALVDGNGAGSISARGNLQQVALTSLNPYDNNNFQARWQEYTRWYNTSWEVRKIIDIPIDDAFRVPFEIEGLEDKVKSLVMHKYEKLHIQAQLKRALKQERLYGGAVLLPIFNLPEKTDLNTPLKMESIDKGDLLAVNVIDVSQLARIDTDTNPFEVGYDRMEGLQIAGVPVHYSRFIAFSADALAGYATQNTFTPGHYNPCGFGESKIAPIYDLLIRVTGTQQAAYHLINMASILVLQVENLRSLSAVGSPAIEKLEELTRQISIYRSAIVDGKGVQMNEYAPSFGSIPELLMTFLQILSAACDIPATRFLGEAPGGLNATGEADTRNYYDMVDSIRNTKIKDAETQLINWCGTSVFGYDRWKGYSLEFELKYPPLWTMSQNDQADYDNKYIDMLKGLYDGGMISAESAISEMNARGVFTQQLEAEPAPEEGEGNEEQ